MKLLRNDFFIALLLLAGYLLTNGYVYGWDDQHLEIPILKHLIDPSLYKGDYYVESAVKYFTCWLYPVLAKLITVKQIPAVYLMLFLISRYAMFYFVYRLWLSISGSCFAAVSASAVFFLLGRTDEFLYRSFCHEEFAFIFMFAGLYCFYRERYALAALVLGLAVNFHAIYGLFPMLYMLTFILFCHPQRFKMTFQTGVIFVLASLPFLCWQIPISISREIAHPVPALEWVPLYLISCPQNFLFDGIPLKDVIGDPHVWWHESAQYLILIGLYIFHLALNPGLRRDKKLHAVMALSLLLLGAVYFFDYIHPSRFVLDLNVVRVRQFMRFFMMGYTALWACDQARFARPWLAFSSAVLVLACGTTDTIALFFLGVVSMVYIVDAMAASPLKLKRIIIGGIGLAALGVLVYALGLEFKNYPKPTLHYGHRFIYVIAAMGVVFLLLLIRRHGQWLRRLLIIVPLAGTFCICVSNYHDYSKLMDQGNGGWQLLRNWVDMQIYVRDHTPKNSTLLTPYDMNMGGFRIHSERKVVACFRDCGIIGFDYPAAMEWQKRINDIRSFKLITEKLVDDDIMKAILRYNVDYVVFMRYYGPTADTSLLKKIYANAAFTLFQVL